MLKRIDSLTRRNNSVYGNPSYMVHFTDGDSAITTSNAAFCYGITNKDHHDRPVRVTFTRAGRIETLSPVSDGEAASMRNHPATSHLF